MGKRMAALHWLHALGKGHTVKRRAVEKAKVGGDGGEGGSTESDGKRGGGGGGQGGSAGASAGGGQ